MKKMPLVLIMSLIVIVLISGFIDSVRNSDVHGEHHGLLFSQPDYISKDLSDDNPSFASGDKPAPKDESIFLADNIKKSDEMVERLDSTIVRLNEEGNDVQELEQMVDDYALLVSEAKDYLSKADASTSLSDEQKYLALSRDKIILANSELKGIFDKMQTYLPGPVSISGNDSLNVNGSGIVILSGDLDIDLSFSMGKFSVVDYAGDLHISTDEIYSPEIVLERAIPSVDPEKTQKLYSYVDVRGNVTLSGSELTVAIMSDDDVSLLVKGTGEAELYGNGSYYLDNATMGKEGTWISPIFDID
ncbi:hypothetical protein RE476_08330 [Methanolobus mangrovi]|uniref:Uncharacterized protein n=1 Tax=Methanolobus mangrovi TaxID=3072977 RepID=A0AA51UDZ4_9EURY|nr:hypothetical protein [Methanolobus mangrovi]WMW21411.1 hypothetical protein RE476_08330 [Methanolobus mangrovi]